jgi:antitoxin PrlF
MAKKNRYRSEIAGTVHEGVRGMHRLGLVDKKTMREFDVRCLTKAMESAITSKGQATIPKEIREHLGLKPGDRVKFFFHPDGGVMLLPKRPISALRGMLKSSRKRPATLEEMDEVIAEGAVERYRRSQRR